jgi:phage terminase large subunit-like protein
MRKEKKRNTSPDPVGNYARAVIDGSIIAGPHVRAACQRHLDDLKQAAERGFFFDLKLADRAIGFFRDVLCLNGGEYEGLAYELLPWQEFIVGSLFGWVDKSGFRRFRMAYIETGKGSGKSPLAAGIGMYGLVADKESRAEIYSAATKKDQAMVLFRDAVAMVDHSPALNSVIGKSGLGEKVWNLAYLKTHSFFRPISADDGQSGPRPHIVLLDEIHEHKTGYVIEMLRAGTKGRRQALIVMITNSGFDKQSVCWQYHDYGAKAAAQSTSDSGADMRASRDSFFAYVCALDKDDDPLKDEKCWDKANPSLNYGLPGMKYLREQVTEARGMPGKESIVRRLNFCEWVAAENPWISADAWFACEEKFDIDMLLGRRCHGGLDLSSVRDLTALVLLFEPTDDDPWWRQIEWFWLPEEGLHHKADLDHVPYLAWRDAGFLQVTPGKVIDKTAIAMQCAEIISLYDLQKIGYDRFLIKEFQSALDREGIVLPLEAFGQGYQSMGPAVIEYERLIIGQQLRHTGNPVMTWCAANAVTASDPAGFRKVTKEKSTGRVDGIVAALMAAGVVPHATNDEFTGEIRTIEV